MATPIRVSLALNTGLRMISGQRLGRRAARLLSCGACCRVAREFDDSGWWWRSCFPHRFLLPRGTPRHTVEAHLDALRRIGIWPEDADKPLVLVPGADANARADALLAASGLERGRFV